MDPEKVMIEFLHSKKFSPAAIIKRLEGLSICDRKVRRVCKRLSEGRLADNRHLSGMRRTVRTPAMIKRVQERIRRNPQRSIKLMSKQLNASARSIHRIVKEDLGLKPYKKRKLHGLTEAQEKNRTIRSKELLRLHGKTDLEHLVFSDEKLFTVEEKLNYQNTRVYSLAFEDIPEHLRTVARFQYESKVWFGAQCPKKANFPYFSSNRASKSMPSTTWNKSSNRF